MWGGRRRSVGNGGATTRHRQRWSLGEAGGDDARSPKPTAGWGGAGRIGGKVHRGRLAGGCGNRRACVVGSDRQMAVCRGLRRGVHGGGGIVIETPS